MNILLITIGLLAVLAIVAALVSKLTKGSNEAVQPTHGDCSTCSGDDDRCEQACYMEAATRPVEYYDDEELDAYRGIAPDGYSDSQIEEFRDVLLTLLPEDIAGWARSLRLRGIEMPACVKEELLLLVSEERERKNMK